MVRWEPNANGRLGQAAMELYLERGFEQTTVADIAERAGLTARTFFRHYTDKREVLFAGATVLQERLIQGLDGAPQSASALEAVAIALDAGTAMLGTDRDFSRQRQSIIEANRELRERELIKMATLASVLADGLRRRGVTEPEASLAAEAGIAVFRVSFERWVNGTDERGLAELTRDSFEQLKALSTN
jgi:AcrR family transcriptional regulator